MEVPTEKNIAMGIWMAQKTVGVLKGIEIGKIV